MSQVIRAGDRLILELTGEAPESRGAAFDFQLLSPLLLGLMVPFIAASYFAPESLSHLKWPIWIFLCTMFALCSALFFYTHHCPGRIDSIIVNREGRTLELVWRNLMATAIQIVPFQEVAALRVRVVETDEGRQAQVAELVLRSRPPIELPDTIGEQQLRPLRAAIGLG